MLRQHFILNQMNINRWSVRQHLNNQFDGSKLCHSSQVVVLGDDWRSLLLRTLKKKDVITVSNFVQCQSDDTKFHQLDTPAPSLSNQDNNHLVNVDDLNQQIVTPINSNQNGNVITNTHTPLEYKKSIDQLLPNMLVGVDVVLPAFSLSAIRYDDWLLIIDNKMVGVAELAIWQSLMEKLATKAQIEQKIFVKNSLTFPFNADWQLIEDEERLVLTGFLWRLYDMVFPKKMAVLSDMDAVLFNDEFFMEKHATPTLSSMADNAQNKKVFWAMLHS